VSRTKDARPHPDHPGQDRSGRFTKGNDHNRKSGLYARCGLNSSEEKRIRRVKVQLKAAGIPDDVAASLALTWFNACRVEEAFTRIRDDGELLGRLDIWERAAKLKLHVLRMRDAALRSGETGDEEPLWRRAERARDARGEACDE